MTLKVYLSGEIHTDWRNQIIESCREQTLDNAFTSANTDHESSDAAGDVLGPEEKILLARPQVCQGQQHQRGQVFDL